MIRYIKNLSVKTENKVYVCHKIENTLENDPSTECTEYYLQINCNTKLERRKY